MDKDAFTLISRPQDRMKLFTDFGKSHGELLCKGKNESFCKYKAALFNPRTDTLECVPASAITLEDGEDYLGHLFIGGEKYYFESKAIVNQSRLHIPLPKSVYHLQRRQNYRAHVPASFKAYYNIVEINSKPQTIVGKLDDISAQGCKVTYQLEKPLMKLNDYVTGHLIIGTNAPIETQGQIRHIKVDEENKLLYTFGIEFVGLAPIVENKLFSLTMEIHKQIFRS